ncbi:hypothetical protein LINPERPRIM_LOCUS15395 [Linum perenne]
MKCINREMVQNFYHGPVAQLVRALVL